LILVGAMRCGLLQNYLVPMKARPLIPPVAALLAALTLVPKLYAQPLVKIETVTVGDTGNAADTTGYGAVTNVFGIGKYEVTIGQYVTFLNSVASVTSDSYIVNLWNANMTSNLNIAGISRSGSGTLVDAYSYSVIGSGNRPIAYVSWFDAARFANWVDNGATNGASTETGAYTLNGSTNGNTPARNPNATWWIPTEDQWYKAAFYKAGGSNADYWDYATQSDAAPNNRIGAATNQANYRSTESGFVYAVTESADYSDSQNYLTDVGAFGGSASAYGTFDQAGNLSEWNDLNGEIAAERNLRGGAWIDDVIYLQASRRDLQIPTSENSVIGFRLATVPEPSTYALILMTGAGALWLARRKRN